MVKFHRISSVEWNPSPVIALATSADSSQVAAARVDGSLEIWLVSHSCLLRAACATACCRLLLPALRIVFFRCRPPLACRRRLLRRPPESPAAATPVKKKAVPAAKPKAVVKAAAPAKKAPVTKKTVSAKKAPAKNVKVVKSPAKKEKCRELSDEERKSLLRRRQRATSHPPFVHPSAGRSLTTDQLHRLTSTTSTHGINKAILQLYKKRKRSLVEQSTRKNGEMEKRNHNLEKKNNL